jgi:hypothetical protein
MSRIELTQGDDWQLDLYLEEKIGDGWVPLSASGRTLAMGLKADGYTQPMAIALINGPGGHYRATLANAATALVPSGRLMSNVQLTEGGKKFSTTPLVVDCIEDYTP